MAIHIDNYLKSKAFKRYRLAERMQKQELCICCSQETHFRPRNIYRLKVRGWKKIFYTNGNQKKVVEGIFTSDEVDFKIKAVIRVDKDTT